VIEVTPPYRQEIVSFLENGETRKRRVGRTEKGKRTHGVWKSACASGGVAGCIVFDFLSKSAKLCFGLVVGGGNARMERGLLSKRLRNRSELIDCKEK
jgi:hypothetical protein